MNQTRERVETDQNPTRTLENKPIDIADKKLTRYELGLWLKSARITLENARFAVRRDELALRNSKACVLGTQSFIDVVEAELRKREGNA